MIQNDLGGRIVCRVRKTRSPQDIKCPDCGGAGIATGGLAICKTCCGDGWIHPELLKKRRQQEIEFARAMGERPA